MKAREIRVRLYFYLMGIPYASTGKPLDLKKELDLKFSLRILNLKKKIMETLKKHLLPILVISTWFVITILIAIIFG